MEKELKLYLVDYKFGELEIEFYRSDQWILACRGRESLDDLLKYNKNKFSEYEYDFKVSRIREITKTHNGHEVLIKEKNK